MKVRVVRDWRTKARTVRVTLTGRETLNYALAERLKHTDLPFLPPFKYQIKGDSAVLFYDITGCMKIRKFMEAKISVGQYQDIIQSVADITDICTEASAPTESVLWDKKYIYISQPVPHPVYIIVPAHGIAPGHPTANDLLMYLSDASKVHFPNDDGNIYVEIVRDYVRRNPIFSSVTLRDWMVKKGVIAQAGMSSGQFLSPDMGTAAQNRQPAAQAMQLQPPLPVPPAASVPADGFAQEPGWDPVGTVLGENGAVEYGSLGESVVKEVSRVPDTSRKDDNAYTPVVDSALLTMMPSAGFCRSGAGQSGTSVFPAAILIRPAGIAADGTAAAWPVRLRRSGAGSAAPAACLSVRRACPGGPSGTVGVSTDAAAAGIACAGTAAAAGGAPCGSAWQHSCPYSGFYSNTPARWLYSPHESAEGDYRAF